MIRNPRKLNKMALEVLHNRQPPLLETEPTGGLLPAWVNPDLDRLMIVRRAEGDYKSWAESLVDLPAGAVFARITGVTPVSPPTWSSVQVRKQSPFLSNTNEEIRRNKRETHENKIDN